jgi:hypothetical protein
MTVLLIVAIIAAALAVGFLVIKGLSDLQGYAIAKYGHKFFRISHFATIIASGGFCAAGYIVQTLSDGHEAYISNGLVLMLIGAGLAGALFCQNCRKTSFLCGASGTVVEVMVTPWILNIGIILIGAIILGVSQYLTAKPVRVVREIW